MNEAGVPYGRKTQRAPAVKEIHVLWITAGLVATGTLFRSPPPLQPSVEDVLMGAIPGLPKVHLHNPVLAYEVGDDFMKYWYLAEQGKLDPFVLVVEGSIPNEKIKKEGYWAALGTNPDTGQPITTCEWIDRLAPKALAVVAAGTCATYGGIHAMEGNPTGCMGLADYLGWNWKSKAGLPIVNVPGCPVQPDNFMETLLYLLYQAGGPGADDSAGRKLRPELALRPHRPRRVRPRRLLRTGRVRRRIRHAGVSGENRLLGSGRQLQRDQARLDGWHRRLSRTWAAFASAAPCPGFRINSCRLWMSRRGPIFDRPRWKSYGRADRSSARIHEPTPEQRAEVAASGYSTLTTGYKPTTY